MTGETPVAILQLVDGWVSKQHVPGVAIALLQEVASELALQNWMWTPLSHLFPLPAGG